MRKANLPLALCRNQLMPYTKVNQAMAGHSAIAQTIAVPHEHKPQRLPTFPNLERTAAIATIATGTSGVTGGTVREFALMRSPTYPLWTLSAASTGAASVYYKRDGQFGKLTSVGDTVVFANDCYSGFGYAGADTTWTSSYSQKYPQCVLSDGRVFLKTATAGFTAVMFTCSNFVGAIDIDVESWDGSETTNYNTLSSVTVAGSPAIISLSLFGPWFRIVSMTLHGLTSGSPSDLTDLRVGISSGGTLTVPLGTGVQFFGPVFSTPEYTTASVPYASSRANAAAVLFSNVTAVLDKDGTVTAARVPRVACHPWEGTAAALGTYDSTINAVYPKDRYFGPLEKGLYTYTLSDAAVEAFHDYTNDIVGAPPRFYGDSYDYVTLIQFRDLGGNGSTMAITLDTHLEFRSSSMLFPVGFSNTQLEVYHSAQMALAQLGVFFENPTHLSTIIGLVRSAVMRLAPIVAPYAKQAVRAGAEKLLDMAAKQLSTKMPQAGFQTPKPTVVIRPRVSTARSQKRVTRVEKRKKKR